MQHEIPRAELGALGNPMAEAVEACVHCGLCLPACPTYQLLGEEMDSPRGRIILMKEVLEGNLPLEEATPYLDACLGCLACVSACPSGVRYGELITPFRLHSEPARERPSSERLLRRLLLAILPFPRRFRLAATLGWLVRPLNHFPPVRRLLPAPLEAMLELLPGKPPAAGPLPEHVPAQGERRARVALLNSCTQQVLAPDITWATLRVLTRNGVEVVIPREQGCCGALAAHTGEAEQARACARRNLQAFPDDVDAVLTNAAGCGSGMREYDLWLADEPEAAAANTFSRRVVDVSVFLCGLGITPPPPLTTPLKVAYHDACHLAHAQGVRRQPRELLAAVEGLTLLELEDGDRCCGSAGSYSLEHPEVAAELGARQAREVLATGAQALVSGNIGCLVQLQAHLRKQGGDLPVYHTVQLLDRAYRGE